jgi:hypothetical protein
MRLGQTLERSHLTWKEDHRATSSGPLNFMARKLTNKLSLPQPIVDAVTNDPYTKANADVSVTELLKPPQIAYLERKHENEIVEDVSDRIWSLLGQVTHGILERAGIKTDVALTEEIMILPVKGEFGTWNVKGQVDYFLKDGVLYDYKLTSLYKVKDGLPQEWEEQQNCYAEMLRAKGQVVNRIVLVAILRDWSAGKVGSGYNYPEQQIVQLESPVWTPAKARLFLEMRVSLHQKARIHGIIPQCTPEERWEGWNKAAKKVISRRCEKYCAVSDFCQQARQLGVPMKGEEEAPPPKAKSKRSQ